MGRVGARSTRLPVSFRLTWTFSARLGTAPPPGSRRSVLPRPAPAVLRAVRRWLPHRRRHG
ncbi:hypothetical protein [Streptomyces griseoluteus]|uniref:hypothetical protein n=1 Tax=Streptomyces griseoluteus TaxID=29306 RepID=UPI0036F6B8E7